MKKYNISTELVRLDIKEILANYKNPKFWRKKWTIFKHKDFVIFWKMSSIEVENNKISSKVCLEYNGKRQISWYLSPTFTIYCDNIPIDNSDYSQTVFSRNILAAVLQSIDALEKELIKHSYEYREAYSLECDEEEKLTEIANDFLDSEHVTNDEIREVYIDYYVKKAQRYSYTKEVMSSAIRKYYPTARLLACSWFDYKKKFDEEMKILEETKNIKKKVIYSIWKSRKELDGEAYLEEAQEQLEAL